MSLVQQQVQVPQVIDAYPQNDKYYLKAFLVNDRLNGMGWKLNPAYMEQNIKKFIGKPLILTQYKNHPHEFKHYKQTGNIEYDKQKFLELQKPHEIGTIVNVLGNRNLAQGDNNNEYTAIIEVTDPNAIKSFKEQRVPLFVSPSILRTSGEWTDIQDFEALHLAVVDDPAFGIEVANVRKSCEADQNTCMSMLAQAGTETIKKCPYEILKTVNNLYQSSQNIPESIVPKSVSSSKDNIIMTEPNVPSTETAPQNAEQVAQEQNVIDTKIAEQKQENSQEVTPIGTPKISQEQAKEETKEAAPAAEETPCEEAARKYDEKIAELEKEIKLSKEFRENYHKEQKANKVQAKLDKIENAIPKDYANSEEERAKVIESLQKIPDAELDMFIEKFVVPATKPKAAQRKHTEFLKQEVPAVQNNAQASQKKNIRLSEMNRLLSFTGINNIVPNNKKGVNS